MLKDFSDIYVDIMADLPYTEPAFIAYLKGEKGVPLIDNSRVRFSKSASGGLKNISADREIVESGNVGRGKTGM